VLVEGDDVELNNAVGKLVAEKAVSVVDDTNTEEANVASTSGGGVVGSAVSISEDLNILEVCEDEEPNLELEPNLVKPNLEEEMVDVVGTIEAVVVEENIALKNPSKLLLSIFLGVLKDGLSWKWWASRGLEKLSSP